MRSLERTGPVGVGAKSSVGRHGLPQVTVQLRGRNPGATTGSVGGRAMSDDAHRPRSRSGKRR